MNQKPFNNQEQDYVKKVKELQEKSEVIKDIVKSKSIEELISELWK